MSSCKEKNWSNLPDVVLTNTFSYLPHKDRFATSLVCRHWESSFHNPSLWNRMKFSFGSDQLSNAKAMQFLESKQGSYLKSLEVKIEQVENRDSSTASLIAFFDLLRIKEYQLSEFVLINCDEFVIGNILHAILKFLNSQKQLRILSIEGYHSNIFAIVLILRSAVLNSRDSLEVLKVPIFCYRNFDENISKFFMDVISYLKNLRFLSLRHRCIDENSLKTITEENAFAKFGLLELKCTYDNADSESHILSAEAWKLVKKIFKNVKVSYFIDITEVSEIYEVLPEPIPLTKLDLSYKGDNASFPELIQYIGDISQDSLEYLRLDGIGVITEELLIDAIAESLEKLHELQRFEISGINPEAAVKFLEKLRLEKFSKLKEVYLYFDYQLEEEFETALTERAAMFIKRGVDFKLEFDYLRNEVYYE